MLPRGEGIPDGHSHETARTDLLQWPFVLHINRASDRGRQVFMNVEPEESVQAICWLHNRSLGTFPLLSLERCGQGSCP